MIAARIARHRDRRHLEVYEQLTELLAVQAEQPEDGADVWLKVAAKVARKATAAAVALVFRQAPDLTLRGVAADPPEIDASLCNAKRDSLIRKVFEQRVQKRVLDHSDLQERVRIFGTEACDTSLTDGLQLILQTPLRSWIAAAVTCDDEPIAVMFVANKRFESLPEVFSGTDSELIGSICKILAHGLAQAQTNHAIWKISDFTFRHAVHEPTERRDLLKLVQSHVPGIVAGAVSLRLREQDPPDEQWEMGELEPNAMTVLNARMQRPLRIPTSTSLQKLAVVDTGHAPPYYVYEQRLPYVSEGRTAVVHLASRRERLAKFELDVLRYFGADLCQVIRSEQMVRQAQRGLYPDPSCLAIRAPRCPPY